MYIELHSHTAEHSPCSTISAAELATAVHRKGAAGVVFTDHHYLWSDEELAELRGYLDLPKEFLILSGQEIFTRDFGDVLVYGASCTVSESMTLAAIRTICPEAALVWAHPYRYGQRPTGVELFDANLDAVEIFNPRQRDEENWRGRAEWKTLGFVATSGTDIHENHIPTLFATRLDHAILDIHGLVRAIKDGLCHPCKSPS